MTPPLDPRARLSARVVISLLLLAACTPETTVAGDADAGAMPPPANAARDGDEAPAPAPAVIADDPDAPRYLEPSPDIVKVVDAPPTPLVAVDPTGRRLLQITRASLPGIDVVAEPFLRLGGVRIGPRRNERRRTEYFTGLSIKRLADAVEVPVNLPEGSLLGYPSWSFDGAHVAVTRAVDDGLELWIIDAETGAARQLLDAKVTDVVGAAFTWLPGSRSLLVRLVPDPSARPPEAPRVPSGPVVQDTVGRAAKNRTYQDLLANAHDSAVFEHFARSQLARVDLKGAVTKLGAPGIYPDVDPSPDGARLLVTEIKRPYSYVVPYYWFTRDITVWGEAGPERTIAALPASEEVPIQGVPEGPREVTWQPHRASALVWAEALDGGDPERDVPQRDKLMRLDLAADGAPVELLRTDERLYDVTFTDVAELALVSEYDRDRRWLKTMIHTLDRPERPPEVLIDRSVHDRYGDPGWPVTHVLKDGSRTARVDDGWIYLEGPGATPEGDRPFLDRRKLVGGATERLMQAPADAHHEFIAFADPALRPGSGPPPLVVLRESKTTPPNFHLTGRGDDLALTAFPHPYPELAKIEKRLLTYKRRDGVTLSGTLYLPPSYKEGERLPLVIWAYPLEYNDADTAGQVRAAPNRFTRLAGTSPLLLLLAGYAVLDDAAMPVVGDPKTMNDTFVQQVVASASAAIDAVVAEGVADRERVAVAGHSYGAFMTANLLAHSNLFRAGIARSGAYNRALTPFGFQGERRTLWEARDTYVKVSPLFHADTIKAPILLIHGEDDNNSGTFPLQSKRLFHALQGLGGTSRLVLLPAESHGYQARESALHVLAESIAWLDAHLAATPAKADEG